MTSKVDTSETPSNGGVGRSLGATSKRRLSSLKDLSPPPTPISPPTPPSLATKVEETPSVFPFTEVRQSHLKSPLPLEGYLTRARLISQP